MKLKSLLFLSFISLSLFTLVIGINGIRSNINLKSELEKFDNSVLPAVNILGQINFERMRLRTQTLDIQSMVDFTHENQSRIQNIQNSRRESLKTIESLEKQFQLLEDLDNLSSLHAEYIKHYTSWLRHYELLLLSTNELINSRSKRQFDEVFDLYNKQVIDMIPDSEQMGRSLEQLVNQAETYAQQESITAINRAERTISVAIILLMFGIAFSFICATYITSRIMKQLGGDPEEVRAVVSRVSSGDFSSNESLKNKAIKGSLLFSFLDMVTELRNMITRISEASNQVAAAAEQLSASSSQTNVSISTQSQEATQVATAMSEMTATVAEVARHTSSASSASQVADQEAEAGRAIVKDVVSSIHSLADTINSSANTMDELIESSSDIASVLDVIQNIAEQTNLLALNAAIEAARAGEYGRGFAVVADEVRSLATRTQSSIEDIHRSISRVQQSSAKAADNMKHGFTQSSETVEKSLKAGQALEAINRAVESIHEMNIQIATAAEQQSSVAEEINKSVLSISQTIDDTAQSADQVASASNELARLSIQLKKEVGRFKI